QIPHSAWQAEPVPPGPAELPAAPRPCRANADRLRAEPRLPLLRTTLCQVLRTGGGCGSARPQGGGWLGAAGALEGRDIVRVHVVVPEEFDNPGQPTGGNIYDQRVCAGLAEIGWEVLVATVAAAWPVPSSSARAELARVLSAIPDGETVL